MTEETRVLSQGLLGTGKQTICGPVAPKIQLNVERLTLVNAGALQTSVNLYLRSATGASNRMVPKDMLMDPGDTLVVLEHGERIGLPAGYFIEGDADQPSAIEFTAAGIAYGP